VSLRHPPHHLRFVSLCRHLSDPLSDLRTAEHSKWNSKPMLYVTKGEDATRNQSYILHSAYKPRALYHDSQRYGTRAHANQTILYSLLIQILDGTAKSSLNKLSHKYQSTLGLRPCRLALFCRVYLHVMSGGVCALRELRAHEQASLA